MPNTLMKYQRIIQEVQNSPWCILPNRLSDIMDVLQFKSEGGMLTAEEIQQYIGINAKRSAARASVEGGSIAVLSLRGIIAHRIESVNDISGPGGTSVEGFRSRYREAMNASNVSGIVIDVDSPGGNVSGLPELAAELYETRGQKPVIAVANTLAASAAYWLASAVDEFSVTPSGEVGSIGVYTAHDDISARMEAEGIKRTYISFGENKVEGNPAEPLSDSAKDYLQNRVNEVGHLFVDSVAKHRNVSAKTVRESFGDGRAFGANDALERGMVDRVETIEQAIQRLQSGSAKKSRRRSARYALAFA